MAPMAGCTEGPQGCTHTPKHGPHPSVTGKPSRELWAGHPWAERGRVLSPACPSPPAHHCSSQETFAYTDFESREAGERCTTLSPYKTAFPNSTSITGTTGRVLIPSRTQHEDERDGFKFPAHPD